MLLLFLALPLLAGFLGGMFGPDAWFAALAKPAWNPPGWIFAPVWTALYLMMGVAAWLVWRAGGGPRPLALWGVQLVLNGLWTPLFFGLHRPDLALVDILALWVVVLLTILAFRRVRPLAAGLLLPYLGWLTFAVALNFSIWRLNP